MPPASMPVVCAVLIVHCPKYRFRSHPKNCGIAWRLLLIMTVDLDRTGRYSLLKIMRIWQSWKKGIVLWRHLDTPTRSWLIKKKLRGLVPAASDHCIGALYCQGDGFAEPYLTSFAFRGKAASLGAQIYENTPVTAIERSQSLWHVRTGSSRFEAPILVNCAGAWGSRIASWVGDNVPLTPTPLMMMVTARVQSFLRPVVGLAGRKLSFKQMPSGTVVIGGGYISKLNMEREKTIIDFTQLKISAQTVRDVFPLMKHVPIVRSWAGIEGVLPDQIPVIGPSRNAPQAFHAFGFSGHGFQLSPIIGQILSELIIQGRSSLPIEAFRVGRFADYQKDSRGPGVEDSRS